MTEDEQIETATAAVSQVKQAEQDLLEQLNAVTELSTPLLPVIPAVLTLTGQHRGEQINEKSQKFAPSLPCYDIEILGETLYSRVAAHRIESTLIEEATTRQVGIMPVIAKRFKPNPYNNDIPELDQYGDPVPSHQMFVDVLGGELHGASLNNACQHQSYLKVGIPGVDRCSTPNDNVAVPCVRAWLGKYYEPPRQPYAPEKAVMRLKELAMLANA